MQVFSSRCVALHWKWNTTTNLNAFCIARDWERRGARTWCKRKSFIYKWLAAIRDSFQVEWPRHVAVIQFWTEIPTNHYAVWYRQYWSAESGMWTCVLSVWTLLCYYLKVLCSDGVASVNADIIDSPASIATLLMVLMKN